MDMCTSFDIFSVTYLYRSSNAIAVTSLKQPWHKRQIERAEKKSMKEFERELKEEAQRQKAVCSRPLIFYQNYFIFLY